jgi:hypothetical protein
MYRRYHAQHAAKRAAHVAKLEAEHAEIHAPAPEPVAAKVVTAEQARNQQQQRGNQPPRR